MIKKRINLTSITTIRVMVIFCLLLIFLLTIKVEAFGKRNKVDSISAPQFTSTTMLSFYPLSSSVDIGNQITVDVVVENVSELYGISIDITFDPNLLQVVDVDTSIPGVQITPGNCPSPDFVVKNTANNASGLIEYDVASLSPSTPCNGNGTIAAITFQGTAEGTSSLNYDNWLLSDSNGFPIAATSQEGEIRVDSRMYNVYLPLIIWNQGNYANLNFYPSDTSIAIGNQITIDVVIENVEDLYGISIDINFNPSLVQVIDTDSGTGGVQISPGSCPSPDFVVKNTTDNTSGLIEYDVSSLSPSNPCNGSGTVARVTFQGIATGTTSLHFENWLLSDSNGIEILAIPNDGSIQVVGQKMFWYSVHLMK